MHNEKKKSILLYIDNLQMFELKKKLIVNIPFFVAMWCMIRKMFM